MNHGGDAPVPFRGSFVTSSLASEMALMHI